MNKFKKKGIDVMYISPFLAGFIAGAVIATVLIVAWALYVGRKDKK